MSLADIAPVHPFPWPDRATIGLQIERSWTSRLLGDIASAMLDAARQAGEGDCLLYCVDAANCFDPYAMSLRARRDGVAPEALLERVRVTRCFTIHQLAAVAAEMLPPLARRRPSAAIVVLGVDELFREESLPWRERARVLAKVARSMGSLPPGARLLATHDAPPPDEPWWRPMLEFGDWRGALVRDDGGHRFEFERNRRLPHGPHASHLQHVPPGGDRLLESLPPRLEGGAQAGLRPSLHAGAHPHGGGLGGGAPRSLRRPDDGDLAQPGA